MEANFAEVASTLFPGGEGRLRLTEPEGDEEEPGIEVELRPAGKRISRLSLLSGGEKALGALSFLFALFLARPCPFYLLDEVEAALDDANIGRFVELLRQFSERAQFIVVTHQKRTMEAADVLYGVTMGRDGVSQVVSRRLPREEAERRRSRSRQMAIEAAACRRRPGVGRPNAWRLPAESPMSTSSPAQAIGASEAPGSPTDQSVFPVRASRANAFLSNPPGTNTRSSTTSGGDFGPARCRRSPRRPRRELAARADREADDGVERPHRSLVVVVAGIGDEEHVQARGIARLSEERGTELARADAGAPDRSGRDVSRFQM